MTVAVHAHGADGVKLALAYGADSIEHGTLIDDEAIKLFVVKNDPLLTEDDLAREIDLRGLPDAFDTLLTGRARGRFVVRLDR